MSAYAPYPIEQLWAMLQSEGGPEADRLIQAWKDTTEAVDDHVRIMTAARDELVRAWPPEGSEASRAFVRFVEDLIDSMRAMTTAASDNHTAVRDMSATLAKAKGDIGRLRDMLARTPPQNKVNAMTFDPANPTNAGQRFQARAWEIMD